MASWVIDPAAVSARLRINLFFSTTDAFEALTDSMYINKTEIFEDGFESSDTGRWFSAVP